MRRKDYNCLRWSRVLLLEYGYWAMHKLPEQTQHSKQSYTMWVIFHSKLKINYQKNIAIRQHYYKFSTKNNHDLRRVMGILKWWVTSHKKQQSKQFSSTDSSNKGAETINTKLGNNVVIVTNNSLINYQKQDQRSKGFV